MLTLAIVMVCVACSGADAAPQNGATRSAALVDLGRRLFEDERLSADGTVSCAKCHIPKQAFTDGRQRAQGVHDQPGTRNTPSLLNIAEEQEMFWDGRVTGLEAQVRSPLFNPREQALANDDQVKHILTNVPEYVTRFREVYGPDAAISTDHVATAIAAFERTLLAAPSPFDRYWYGHQKGALSDSARRGLELFRNQAGCAGCHSIGATSASFSDHQFHTSSVRIDPSVLDDLPGLTAKVAELHALDGGTRLNDLVASDRRVAELGRFVATLDPVDIGKFRTPSLRNVARTAPYMHDGNVESLAEAVDLELYSRGAAGAKPIVLTAQERADVIEFLQALSSGS